MKTDKKKKIILISIIGTIIIILIMLLTILKLKKQNTNLEKIDNDLNTTSEQTATENEEVDEEEKRLISKLKKVSEAERIRIYLGKYFKHIEKKEYDKAYELLYPQFKENYFPTLEDYEKYIAEQQYAEVMTIDYDDIHMQGKYYIVTVKIGDLLSGADIVKKEKTFIVQENGYNDYYISLKK